ncbi:MAG: SGNH/GDSL hydrolase family protein [Kiritimatiellae bacterium]|nr:SGNH/GDSL hydrolase family protein [Kiritimatiellia bacterium]
MKSKIMLSVIGLVMGSLFADPYKDGDVVVFFGDSITHGGRYHEFITDFYRTRFPERQIRFINAGVGGDAASRAINRIDNDIVPYNPTHVTIHFGMNDVGRLFYSYYPEKRELTGRVRAIEGWYNSTTRLVGAIKKAVPNAKLMYFTPTPYDDTAVNTNKSFGLYHSLFGCNGGLAMMAGHVIIRAEKEGVPYVNFYTPLNSFVSRHQKKDPSFMMTRKDRVHPTAIGHAIMAWTFLEAQNVPSTVSDVEIDAKELKALKCDNATVSDISGGENALQFKMLAKSLPFPVVSNAVPYIAEFNVEEKFNRERLCVKGLSSGEYELTIGTNVVGKWTSEELEKGILLGFNTKTPQYAHAQEVFRRQEAVMYKERTVRNAHYARWCLTGKVDVNDAKKVSEYYEKQKEIDKNFAKNFFIKFTPQYIEYWPKHEEVHAQLWEEQEDIRKFAQPKELKYEIKKVK